MSPLQGDQSHFLPWTRAVTPTKHWLYLSGVYTNCHWAQIFENKPKSNHYGKFGSSNPKEGKEILTREIRTLVSIVY